MSASPVPPRRSDGAQRTARVVERALDRVAIDGERAFARARVVVLAAVAVAWTALTFDELRTGLATPALVLGIILSALAASLAIRVVVRRTQRASRRFALASILLDTSAAGAVFVAVAVAPPPDYIGVLHVTGLPIVAITIAGAGLRLSRRNVLLAGGVGSAMFAFAYVLDHRLNAGLTQDGPRHLAMSLLLLCVATVVGWLAAQRTRAVALEAASQTLLAERARAHLGAYVSEEIAELSLQAERLRLGGERLRAAVLFTDLRNFTGQSEDADPEVTVRTLNEYFEAMVDCVRAHHGVVDKYIGDSLMAVFGAPRSRGDDAGNAIRAAAAMVEALARLNAQRAQRSLPPIAHGIGVHIGTVVAGNIGTAERAQYTVIGDAVNVAARLESETKRLGVEVLFSADVVDAADPSRLPPLRVVGDDDGIFVKGRAAPVRLRTLAATPPS